MNKLDDVDTDALRDALAEAPTAKAAKRLMVAIAYAKGIRVETLSDRYGIPRATVYSWLDRFETRPINEAVADESRPGRPPRLDETQRRQVVADLSRPPTESGYDESEWSPDLFQRHLERAYETIYSPGHARRLFRRLYRTG